MIGDSGVLSPSYSHFCQVRRWQCSWWQEQQKWLQFPVIVISVRLLVYTHLLHQWNDSPQFIISSHK